MLDFFVKYMALKWKLHERRLTPFSYRESHFMFRSYFYPHQNAGMTSYFRLTISTKLYGVEVNPITNDILKICLLEIWESQLRNIWKLDELAWSDPISWCNISVSMTRSSSCHHSTYSSASRTSFVRWMLYLPVKPCSSQWSVQQLCQI